VEKSAPGAHGEPVPRVAPGRGASRKTAPAPAPAATPPPFPAFTPPGPVASAAAIKNMVIERELALLAIELGVGRDAALLRALSFYRKFCHRGRRLGHAPEAFFRALLDAYQHRDIHAELSRIREKVAAIAADAAPARRRPGAPAEPTALEIYRAAKAQRAGGGLQASDSGLRGGRSEDGFEAPAPAPQIARAERRPEPPRRTPLPESAARKPEPVREAVILPLTPAIEPPEPKGQYGDRRAKLPKITF
jgi:hypothetical protein